MSQVLFPNPQMLATKLFLFYLTPKHREDDTKERVQRMEPTLYKIWIGQPPPLVKKINYNTALVCGNFYVNKAISKSQLCSNCSVAPSCS